MPPLLIAFLMALQTPSVSTEALGEGAWRLTLRVEGETDPVAASRLLQPTAAELCGVRGYYFDRYSFSVDQQLVQGDAPRRPDVLTLVQNVLCGTRPESAAVSASAPVMTEAGIQAANPEIEILTRHYFSALDEGRHADTYAMADPSLTGGAPLEIWSLREQGILAQAGAVSARAVGRISWYSNPPGLPSGHYVAVDYVASRSLQNECGYLVWYRAGPDKPFLLSRQETTFLPHDLDSRTTAELRRQHCIIL